MQPSDEDAQGNVLPDKEIERKSMADVQRTPSKENSKPAAQPEGEEIPLSAEQSRNRLRKRYHESEQMKKLFTDLVRDNQKQFKEQGEKHTMEIAALKRANLDTQKLLITTALLNNRTGNTVEMKVTNVLTQHTVVIATKTNVHEMIADDHPREITPTPTHAVCAAQAITTETVHHSTMTKKILEYPNNT
jgi:hypothetical protein